MFGFGKQVEPQPRDREMNAIETTLAEMNRLRAAEPRYRRDGSHIMTTAILEAAQSKLWRQLVDEYDVLPIHDEHTGRWKLFQSRL